MLDELKGYGIFVLPCGELECWLPDLERKWEKEDKKSKTPHFIATMEALGNYDGPLNGDVWEFIERVVQFLMNGLNKV